MSNHTSPWRALLAGFAGAVAVNIVHELTRYAAGGNPPSSKVPRLDRLGQAGLSMMARRLGMNPPHAGPKRYATALAGDVLINSMLYAATTSVAKNPLSGGVGSGILAGIAGLTLPKLVGLERHVGRSTQAKAMTFADYAIGGIVTGVVLKALSED